MLNNKTKRILRIVVITLASLLGLYLIYPLLQILFFTVLLLVDNPDCKETVYTQDTSVGEFSLIINRGDPLSKDAWEYFLDGDLIKWSYVDYSDHIDTLTVGNKQLYLVVHLDKDGDPVFMVQEQDLTEP